MKRLFFWMIAAVVIVAAGRRRLQPVPCVAKRRRQRQYRTAPVKRGEITLTVNSSGTVQPVLSVQVGSFVSGPIQKVYVDFNDKVKKDQILAEIDPLIYKGQCRQAKAALAHADADLLQAKARLNQAERDWKRAKELSKITDIPGTDRPIKASPTPTTTWPRPISKRPRQTWQSPRRQSSRTRPPWTWPKPI